MKYLAPFTEGMTMQTLSFPQWLNALDYHLVALCGLDHHSLADGPLRDLYDDQVSPCEAAEVLLVDYNDLPDDLLLH